MVLEIDLDNLVGQAEHDGVPGAHPLLDVDHVHDASRLFLHVLGDFLVRLRLLCSLKVASEVLQQRHFLLEILGVVRKGVLETNVLSVGTSALHVIEMEAVRVEDDLGRVVKEDSSRFVA